MPTPHEAINSSTFVTQHYQDLVVAFRCSGWQPTDRPSNLAFAEKDR